jgi:hypothetical protein
MRLWSQERERDRSIPTANIQDRPEGVITDKLLDDLCSELNIEIPREQIVARFGKKRFHALDPGAHGVLEPHCMLVCQNGITVPSSIYF